MPEVAVNVSEHLACGQPKPFGVVKRLGRASEEIVIASVDRVTPHGNVAWRGF